MDYPAGLSVQLWSLRDMGAPEAQLDLVAGLGFGQVELLGRQLDAPGSTRRMLEQRGLTAPSAHVPLSDLRTRFDHVAEAARDIGTSLVVLPYVPVEDQSADATGWRRLGQELGVLAERFAARGLGFAYHNHDLEFRALPDGTWPVDALLEGAGGAPLVFEADPAWIVRAGMDPLAGLDHIGARLRAVHVKDIAKPSAPPEEEGWADLGAGVMDWARLLPEAQARGARLFVLEHDRPSDPARFAQASRAAFLALTGGLA